MPGQPGTIGGINLRNLVDGWAGMKNSTQNPAAFVGTTVFLRKFDLTYEAKLMFLKNSDLAHEAKLDK